MTWWRTESGVAVVELDEEAPWYWVLLSNWLGEIKGFWFRGNPQDIMDTALVTDMRRVEVLPETHVNEWRTE